MHANKLKSPITCDVYQLAVEMCRLFYSVHFFLLMQDFHQNKKGGLQTLFNKTVSRLNFFRLY